MSGLIHSEGRTDFAQGNGKSYVSTKPFNQEFNTYTVSMNASFQQVGTLAAVTSNAALTPAGRILHLTGRKLYPGVNVDVTKFLVSVYDPITFLTGFIDPSSSTFAKYDQNLPGFFDRGPTANGSSIPPLGGQAGKLTLADSGDQSVVAKASSPNAVDCGDSTVGEITITRISGSNNGGIVTITTSGCRPGSRIILSPVNAVTYTVTVRDSAGTGTTALAIPAQYFVSSTAEGSFDITVGAGVALSADPKFNWLIVN